MSKLPDIEVYLKHLKSTRRHKKISAVECRQENSLRYIRRPAEEEA